MVINSVDDLTIRGVQPWTAKLVAAPDHPDFQNLITISGVSGTRLQWLRIVAPAPAGDGSSCGIVRALIRVADAPDTTVRANQVRANGTDTLGGPCGYQLGVEVEDSDHALIAWNRFLDFQSVGIRPINADAANIHHNAVSFRHVNEGPGSFGIGIALNASDDARVARNLVRALPSAGVTTPWLSAGISVVLSNDPEIIGNRVFYASNGLYTFAVDAGLFLENRIRHSQLRGIFADDGTTNSDLTRNFASGGLDDGIFVAGFTSGNLLLENDARSNAGTDCTDLGTANIWTDNLGNDSAPLCPEGP